MDIIAVIDHLSIDIGKLNTIDDCNIDLGDIYHPEKLRLMIHINMLRCSIRYKIVRVNGCFVHILRQPTMVLSCFKSTLKQSHIVEKYLVYATIKPAAKNDFYIYYTRR